jgi:20S proteasome alpha/beta subunit
MTVVVAFSCSDGVVIAADSMITPSLGGLNVGHHHGLKLAVLAGPQLFAFAGDQGQADRFKVMANGSHQLIQQVQHPLDYSIAISQSIIQQLQSTGIGMQMVNTNTILAFEKGGAHHCCVFEGALQPRFLDTDHFYVALGSGKLSADPFLRFLVDIFCPGGKQPTVSEGLFLATWAVQHVIDTNPGGVAGPIRVATFEANGGGLFTARSLPNDEIAEHQQAVESAAEALRTWRSQIQSGAAADDAPAPPDAPAA